MKNFDDFTATLTDDVIESIASEVQIKINEDIETLNFSDSVEASIFCEKSFTIFMNIKLLEKYHNWLHN